MYLQYHLISCIKAHCGLAGFAADKKQAALVLQTSNQVLSIMLECNKKEAANLTAELQGTRQLLEEEGDADSSLFLKVLQVPLAPIK